MNQGGARYAYVKGRSPTEVSVAEIPAWLLALLKDGWVSSSRNSTPPPDAPQFVAAAILQEEAGAVRRAAAGMRNDRLNRAAFTMGKLSACGAIGRNQAETALTSAALDAGLQPAEIRATISSGISAGEASHSAGKASLSENAAAQSRAIRDPLLAKLANLGETDTDNASRLVERYGAVLQFVPERRKWVAFNGRVWREDEAKQQLIFAQESARLIATEADLLCDELRASRRHWAKQSLGAGAIERAVRMAQPHATRSIAEFDSDPYLINAANGTLDLRTDKLRPFSSTDYLTQVAAAPFDPGAQCVRFKKFLREVFAGDRDLVRFVQRFAGYTLTGLITEQCFLFLQGSGANGKSTLIQILQQMLGQYARSTPTETLLAKHVTSSTSNDLARLQGARMVAAIESNPNRQLDEALIKQITGGDRITARFLYAEFSEYTPRFKLWFVANHAPRLRSTDDALWRRVVVLPFDAAIPREQRDLELLSALQTELPGIFAWAVRGCRSWRKHGLQTPNRVLDATRRYRKEVDHVRRFIQECIEPSEGIVTRSKILYERYERWCSETGEHSVSMKALANRLNEAGYTRTRIPGGSRAWRGVKLRE